MPKGKISKASDWLVLIEEWKQSHLNKKNFCLSRNIPYKNFTKWYSRLVQPRQEKQIAVTIDEEISIASFTRKKGGRKPLPQELPREQIIHDLPETEKVCACGHALHKLGEDKSEQLEFIPAQVKVLEHIRYKYGCRQCEEGVKIAPLPPQPIPKSIASPGLLTPVAMLLTI